MAGWESGGWLDAGGAVGKADFILVINSSFETPGAIYSLSSAFLGPVSPQLRSTLAVVNLLDDHDSRLFGEGVDLSKEALLL